VARVPELRLEAERVPFDAGPAFFDAESLRLAAEPVPLDAESLRLAAEPVPLDAEPLRFAAEPVPLDAESLRFAAEPVPLDAESLRFAAEPVVLDAEAALLGAVLPPPPARLDPRAALLPDPLLPVCRPRLPLRAVDGPPADFEDDRPFDRARPLAPRSLSTAMSTSLLCTRYPASRLTLTGRALSGPVTFRLPGHLAVYTGEPERPGVTGHSAYWCGGRVHPQTPTVTKSTAFPLIGGNRTSACRQFPSDPSG
jgi:hypothetical protein